MQRDGGFMDMMQIRRKMMGVIAGMASGIPRIKYHTSIVMDDMYTSTNRKHIQLPTMSNGLVIVTIDEAPSQPDVNYYIAISHYQLVYEGIKQSNAFGGNILRPNGTIGTDPGMADYYPSTGMLELGGSYGYFMQGTKYNIYMIEIE